MIIFLGKKDAVEIFFTLPRARPPSRTELELEPWHTSAGASGHSRGLADVTFPPARRTLAEVEPESEKQLPARVARLAPIY